MGALRRPPQGTIHQGPRRRGDPCDWFRAPARLGQVVPLEARLGRVAPLEVRLGQVAPLEARLGRVAPLEVRLGRVAPLEARLAATPWTRPARQKMEAIRRTTWPHCYLVLAADNLPPRALGQRRCRAILLSGQAGRP